MRSLKYNGRVQGVPSLEHNPTTKAYLLIFKLSRPLDELGGQLLHDFAELAHYAVSRTDVAPSGARRMRSVVEHLEGIVGELDNPPIIMGHSGGGLFTQICSR